MNPTFFCSELSRARPEQLYGTAPEVDTWILLEYPEPWGPRAIADSALPPDVKAWIASLPLRHRALFIRRDYVARSLRGCFIVHSGARSSKIWRIQIEDYRDILNIDLASPPDEFRVNISLYLVCTHGRKDKCCAKFGLPVLKALRDRVTAGDQAWECSHTGGDRFAANVLWLPDGVYYGHVLPAAVDELLASARSKNLHLGHLRGRTCYPRVVQAAEYFARRNSGRLNIEELSFERIEEVTARRSKVVFSDADTQFLVDVDRVEGAFSELLTCAATARRPVTEYHLRDYSEFPMGRSS